MLARALPRKRRKLVLIAFSPFRIKFKRKSLSFLRRTNSFLLENIDDIKWTKKEVGRSKKEEKKVCFPPPPFLFVIVSWQESDDPRLINVSLGNLG